jgi:Amt family ammonium transporter
MATLLVTRHPGLAARRPGRTARLPTARLPHGTAASVYPGAAGSRVFSAAGLFYGHPGQLLIQAGAAGTVIGWDALMTFLILRGIALFMPLRMSQAQLQGGDAVVHGETAYPELDRELALGGAGRAAAAGRTEDGGAAVARDGAAASDEKRDPGERVLAG